MTFRRHSLLFVLYSIFLTFFSAQNETPASSKAQQLESIANELGLDADEQARLYMYIVDGRIGEVAALIRKHAEVDFDRDLSVNSDDAVLDTGVDVKAKDKDGKTPLHHAAELRDLSMIKFLLERGASVNEQDKDGGTPLHYINHPWNTPVEESLLEVLIKAGANIEARNKVGATPLISAMEQSERTPKPSLLVAKMLVEHGANVKAQDDRGRTPLHFKIFDEEMTKLLINKGADVNARDKQGQTPLHVTRWINIARIFIEHGADITAKTNDGYTPLHTTENYDIAKMLIDMGANINAKTNDGKTPLHSTRSSWIAEMLIDKGADVNAQANDGQTPLLSAALDDIAKLLIKRGARIPTIPGADFINVKELIAPYLSSERNDMLIGILKVVRALVLKGAYINKKDWYEETPIYTASKIEGDMGPELVKLLIKANADIQVKSETINSNEFNFIPLQAAIYRGNIKTAKVLIENGACVNVEPCSGQYSDGLTILSSAVMHGDVELVSLLVSKGADVNQKNTNGTTPLHVATMLGRIEMMKVLLKHGAVVDAKDDKGITPLFFAELALITQELSNVASVIEVLKENGAQENPVTLRGETPQVYYDKYLKLPFFVQKNFYTCY